MTRGPEGTAPRVTREVIVTFNDLPLWGVDALFHRVHTHLDKPNVEGKITASLSLYYSLNEEQYRLLEALSDQIWQPCEVKVLEEHLSERGES